MYDTHEKFDPSTIMTPNSKSNTFQEGNYLDAFIVHFVSWIPFYVFAYIYETYS